MQAAIEAIEWLTDRALDALGREEPTDPYALMLLLRRYAETERANLADAIGLALARALDPATRAPSHGDAAWLTMFVEAAAISDDDRIHAAVADLVSSVRQCWGRVHEVEELAWSVDACLAACDIFEPRKLVPAAIDQLESIVGHAYRPGGGVSHDVTQPDGTRGCLGDQVRTASALIAAYYRTGRLPYAMLAEELMQFARHVLWSDSEGGFFDRPAVDAAPAAEREKPFALNCEAARVVCRLAVLHDTKEYRDAAVLAAGADYRQDAARALASVGSRYRDYGTAGAIYAIALGECLMR